MLDRGLAVDAGLCDAELEQQLVALGPVRRLSERAAKVGDGALRRTATARALRGCAQRRDDRWIPAGGTAQQMAGDALGIGRCVGEQARRVSVRGVSLDGRQPVVNRCAYEWMDEPERRLRAQHLDPCERVRRLGCALVVEAR